MEGEDRHFARATVLNSGHSPPRPALDSQQTPKTALMFRLSRPLFQHALKTSTGITGLKVHHNPLPTLLETYQTTLARLSEIPETSVYRQGAEAITLRKLNIVQNAKGDVGVAEKELDDGQIEEAIDVARDELSLVRKMIEWKA